MGSARKDRSTGVHLLVTMAESIDAGPPGGPPAIMFREVSESHGRYATDP